MVQFTDEAGWDATWLLVRGLFAGHEIKTKGRNETESCSHIVSCSSARSQANKGAGLSDRKHNV